MNMRIFVIISTLILAIVSFQTLGYERNKAVPVEKVVYGKVETVRHITDTELIRDKSAGWKHFGGALIGGVIGNQFGDGSGQVAATILGSIIGASIAKNNVPNYRQRTVKLIEMMILTEDKQRVMVIQDYDSHMQFSKGSTVRIVYLQSNTVRVDTAY
ncbi:hypothetical protein CWC15_09960 [Pseudoalteromonas spongiae]|nr:hypothetical protein CWC15_09960 [Pseudoalteromonas spongiae]